MNWQEFKAFGLVVLWIFVGFVAAISAYSWVSQPV